MKKSLTSVCFAGICAVMAIASEARLLSPHALVTLPRPGGVVSAPSGRRAVFAQSEYNTTANKVCNILSLAWYIQRSKTNTT